MKIVRSTRCIRFYELSDMVRCRTMKSLECNDSNFKSDPLFNREPMKLNNQRSDMFTSTARLAKLFLNSVLLRRGLTDSLDPAVVIK